jgi:tetratricopeptide (TPR) repeat protein
VEELENNWRTFRRAGALFVVEQKYSQAEDCWKQALELSERGLFGRYRRLVLEDLAELYWISGKAAKAETMTLMALEFSQIDLGANHPDVALLLKNLAMLYEIQERFDKAEECFKRAIGILATIYGSKHDEIKALLPNYATVLERLGKAEEASQLRKQAGAGMSLSWSKSGTWQAFDKSLTPS